MKEGLVLDIQRDYVVVLSKSGEFLKLQRNSGAAIGEVYRAREYKRYKPSMFYAAAALIAFIITSFAGYTAYANQIVGVIDITGDKTVKLYLNRAGNVQRVEGVTDTNSYKKLPVDKAIEELTKDENPEIKFTDSTKINASATKLKDSNIDFNKINKNLQKTLDEKKVKLEKSKKNEGKKDNNSSTNPGKTNNINKNNNNSSSNSGNGNSSNEKSNNNGAKKNDKISYAASTVLYSRSGNEYIHKD